MGAGIECRVHIWFVIPAVCRRESRGGGVAEDFWVYILASKGKGTLHIGVTSKPAKRIWAHRTGW